MGCTSSHLKGEHLDNPSEATPSHPSRPSGGVKAGLPAGDLQQAKPASASLNTVAVPAAGAAAGGAAPAGHQAASGATARVAATTAAPVSVSPFSSVGERQHSAFGDEPADDSVLQPERLPPPGFEKLSTQDRSKTNSLGELNRQYGFESVIAKQHKMNAATSRQSAMSVAPQLNLQSLEQPAVTASPASWTAALQRTVPVQIGQPMANEPSLLDGSPDWSTTPVGFERAASVLAAALGCPLDQLPADTMRGLINDTSKTPLELAMLSKLLQRELVRPSAMPGLEAVQEAGQAKQRSPELERKCRALQIIADKLQVAKQHKELKIARTIAPRSMIGLWRVLWVVLTELDAALKQPYLKLAVLPRGTPVPQELIQGLWRMDAAATSARISELTEWVLMRSAQTPKGDTVWLVHDAQQEFLRFQLQRDPHKVIEAQKHLARYLGRLSTLVRAVNEGTVHKLMKLWQEVLTVDQPEKAYDRAVQDAWLNDTPDDDIMHIIQHIAQFYNSISSVADMAQITARTIQQQSDLESMAIAYNNMAMLLHKMGRVAEAERLLSDALAAREDLWGADSAALAVFLDSTGVYFANTSRFKEAEAVINRSLGIRRAMFGAAHPDVASCLHNLGLLLKRRNEFDKAESVYRECIEIREKVLDPHDIHLAVSYNNLAVLLANMRRRGEAEPLYKKTLEIMEWAYGPAHLDVASCLYNLGTLQLDMGRLEEASTNLQRSLGIRSKNLGVSSPQTMEVQKKLAAIDFERKAATMGRDDFNAWVKENAFTCMGGACAIGGLDPARLAESITSAIA